MSGPDPANTGSLQLIWMDLEMTGLNPDTDHILEIATIITDNQLHILHEGPVLSIHQDKRILDQMDQWNQTQHGKSGLIEKVLQSGIKTKEAESRTLDFISPLIEPGAGILCGNSIWQDRRFIAQHMPRLDAYLHYRMLDVSSVKILKNMWFPKAHFPKKSPHRALDDITQSIEELRYYRRLIFKPADHPEA